MGVDQIILFAGPLGCGKTTAIHSVSDTPVMRAGNAAETANDIASHRSSALMDYGQITLPEGGGLMRLYGISEDYAEHDSRWHALEARAVGLVLLLDDGACDPLADLDNFLDKYGGLCRRGAAVIGVTRTDITVAKTLERYYRRLHERHQLIPVYEIDARDRAQVIVLINALFGLVQLRSVEREAD